MHRVWLWTEYPQVYPGEDSNKASSILKAIDNFEATYHGKVEGLYISSKFSPKVIAEVSNSINSYIWILLPKEEGYWTYHGNVILTIYRTLESVSNVHYCGGNLKGVIVDIEIPQYRSLLEVISPRKLAQFGYSLRYLSECLKSRGLEFGISTYPLPPLILRSLGLLPNLSYLDLDVLSLQCLGRRLIMKPVYIYSILVFLREANPKVLDVEVGLTHLGAEANFPKIQQLCGKIAKLEIRSTEEILEEGERYIRYAKKFIKRIERETNVRVSVYSLEGFVSKA